MARIVHGDKLNPSYGLRIKVSMVVTRPVSLMYNLFGGNIRITDQASYHPGKEYYKDQCQWELNKRTAVLSCLQLLEPRLMVKKEHATLGIQYLSVFTHNQRDNQLREAFWAKFKDLNK